MTTYSGKISVSDGSIGYSATLGGEWTARQIFAAFADGYATQSDGADWPEGEHIEVMIYPQDGGDTVAADSCTLHADGRGGVRENSELGNYPHAVEWES